MLPHQEPVHLIVLRKWFEPLTKYIKVEDVVVHLFTHDCITQRDKEEVTSQVTHKGRTNAADHLLTNVLLRNPDYESFKVFVLALRETTDRVLADDLEYDYKKLAFEIETVQQESQGTGSTSTQPSSPSEVPSFDQDLVPSVADQTTIPQLETTAQGFVKAYRDIQLEDYDLSKLHIETFVPNVPKDHLDIDFNHRLGKGKFGMVYPGFFSGTKVAVKEIILNIRRKREKTVEELCKDQVDDREFQSNVYVRHANIVMLMAYALEKNCLYLVFEYLEGENWENIIFDCDIHREYQMNQRDKFYLSTQICKGVAYLHQCKPHLTHGDIKPANMIVIPKKTCAKLCDLGLSKLKKKNSTITTGGFNTPGTASYMAPELLVTAKVSTTRSDTWSLAASLYEIFFEKDVWEVSPTNISEVKSKLSRQCHPRYVESPQPGNEDIAEFIKNYMDYDEQQRGSSLNLLRDLQKLEKDFLKTHDLPNPGFDMAEAANAN